MTAKRNVQDARDNTDYTKSYISKSGKTSYSDMKKRDNVCKICGTRKGFLRRYGLDMCRRCFKDNAERLGFRKYD